MWKDARDTRLAEERDNQNATSQAAYNKKLNAEAVARLKYGNDHHHDHGMGPTPGHGRSR